MRAGSSQGYNYLNSIVHVSPGLVRCNMESRFRASMSTQIFRIPYGETRPVIGSAVAGASCGLFGTRHQYLHHLVGRNIKKYMKK